MATLSPPVASKEPRVRGVSTMVRPIPHPSHRSTSIGPTQDFKSATTGVAAKSMRNELNRMVHEVTDPREQGPFAAQMDGFFSLFNRYLAEKAKSEKLDWEKVKSPASDQVVSYEKLPPAPADSAGILGKVAVLKLNGGLGTSMGLGGQPKR